MEYSIEIITHRILIIILFHRLYLFFSNRNNHSFILMYEVTLQLHGIFFYVDNLVFFLTTSADFLWSLKSIVATLFAFADRCIVLTPQVQEKRDKHIVHVFTHYYDLAFGCDSNVLYERFQELWQNVHTAHVRIRNLNHKDVSWTVRLKYGISPHMELEKFGSPLFVKVLPAQRTASIHSVVYCIHIG